METRTPEARECLLLELAKPAALMLCMAVLCSVFYTAFLEPANTSEQHLWDILSLLSLAAGICVASGMLFREAAGNESTLVQTLPVQIFLWAAGVMAVIFICAWFMETHLIFYRDVRRF